MGRQDFVSLFGGAAVTWLGRAMAIIAPTAFDRAVIGVLARRAHPGGNITGLTRYFGGLSGRCMHLFKQAFSAIAHPPVVSVRLLHGGARSSAGLPAPTYLNPSPEGALRGRDCARAHEVIE
jgi:hypothetical protein